MDTGARTPAAAGARPALRLTRQQARELDRLATAEYGLPSIVLMENAGAGAARIARAMLAARAVPAGPDAPSRCAVLCGPGNNGGDGFVVARHLANGGVSVRIVATCAPGSLRGDAATMARVALAMGIACEVVRDAQDLAALRAELAAQHLLVDALLGTGASGAPRTPVADAIGLLVELGARVPVLALDLPSGLDADTGAAPGACVVAARTATFAAEKVGFAAPGAARWLGAVDIVDIGAPAVLLDRVRAGPLTGR